MAEVTVMDVPGRTPHWGTVVWGVGIASVVIVLQAIVMVAYLSRGETNFTEEQLQALIEDSQNNGVVLSLALPPLAMHAYVIACAEAAVRQY